MSFKSSVDRNIPIPRNCPLYKPGWVKFPTFLLTNDFEMQVKVIGNVR